MILADLRELKSRLDLDPNNVTEDKNLWFWIRTASDWIEEWLNRHLMLQQRTEYYKSTGTLKLLLRSRPVFPLFGTSQQITVYLDEAGYYGAASGAFNSTTSLLVYGVDYGLQLDSQDGTYSRSGILFRINNYWPKPFFRQAGLLAPFIGESFGSIKVVYTAGYSPDTLPEQIREACMLLVARFRYIWPLGLELNSESYEDRSISIVTSEKTKMWALVAPLIQSFRNVKY